MLSIVIPFYNEAPLLEETLRALLETDWAEETELVFSDDGGSDGGREYLRARAGEIPALRVVSDGVHRGKGGAVRMGVLASRGDTVLYTDCDLAYGTDQTLALLTRHRESGASVTAASRSLAADGYGGYPAVRSLGSRFLRRRIAAAAGLPLTDPQAGLKCWDGALAREVFARCEVNDFGFEAEALRLAMLAGARFGEFPVRIPEGQRKGKSSVRLLRDAVSLLAEARRIGRSEKKRS